MPLLEDPELCNPFGTSLYELFLYQVIKKSGHDDRTTIVTRRCFFFLIESLRSKHSCTRTHYPTRATFHQLEIEHIAPIHPRTIKKKSNVILSDKNRGCLCAYVKGIQRGQWVCISHASFHVKRGGTMWMDRGYTLSQLHYHSHVNETRPFSCLYQDLFLSLSLIEKDTAPDLFFF